jgi:hypothetical protein
MASGKIVYCGVWEVDHLYAQWVDESPGTDPEVLKQLATSMFKKIDTSYDHQKPFAPYQGYVFQYLVDDERAFLCACTEGVEQRTVTAYLQTVKNEYFDHFMSTARVTEFRQFLQEQAAHFSDAESTDRLKALQTKVHGIIGDMTANVQMMETRGQAIADLQNDSEALVEDSERLFGVAKALRCKLCRDNLKATIAVSCTCVCLIIAIVILIVLLISYLKGPSPTTTVPFTFPTTAPATTTTTTTLTTTTTTTTLLSNLTTTTTTTLPGNLTTTTTLPGNFTTTTIPGNSTSPITTTVVSTTTAT